MADPAQAAQLLSGFYDIEGKKSRWTAKNFSVLLKTPAGSERNGAELALKLYIPDVQIRSLGAMTLSADAGGHELPSRTFSQSNEYTYSVLTLGPRRLRSGFVVVARDFRLNKSSSRSQVGDAARELGVVVTEVGLAPPSLWRGRTCRAAAGLLRQQEESTHFGNCVSSRRGGRRRVAQ